MNQRWQCKLGWSPSPARLNSASPKFTSTQYLRRGPALWTASVQMHLVKSSWIHSGHWLRWLGGHFPLGRGHRSPDTETAATRGWRQRLGLCYHRPEAAAGLEGCSWRLHRALLPLWFWTSSTHSCESRQVCGSQSAMLCHSSLWKVTPSLSPDCIEASRAWPPPLSTGVSCIIEVCFTG